MSADETESDHDYAAIRLRNLIAENENLRVIRLLRDSTGEWSADLEHPASRRREHNYIFQSGVSILGSGGTVEDDQDIFDDESTEAGNDVPNSGSTTVTYETGKIVFLLWHFLKKNFRKTSIHVNSNIHILS